jgi:DNA-binding winged helix-turn-helix (wHTH) protein
MIEFPPYRLDGRAEVLWRHDRAIALRPKTWAVLKYLAERPGLLVTKEELVTAVWKQAAVSDDAISRTIGELRRALHDNARRPRFVRTVHRRGFRFVAALGHSPVRRRVLGPRGVSIGFAADRSSPVAEPATGNEPSGKQGRSEARELRRRWQSLTAEGSALDADARGVASSRNLDALDRLADRLHAHNVAMHEFFARLQAYYERYGQALALAAFTLKAVPVL